MDDNTVARLSKMPLMDAAYRLWTDRHSLDQQEPPPPYLKARQALNRFIERKIPGGPSWVIKRAIKSARDKVKFAADGPTYRRMKRLFPKEEDAAIKQAIGAAVKLDQDCTRFYRPTSAGYPEDIDRAIIRAQIENPGFQEETYKRSGHVLAMAMR